MSYPWKQIAQFHREISIRSEETFFSFKCDDTGSERFSFVNCSVINKTQINSEVDYSDFSNGSVFTDMEHKENEFFIGGLFWYTNKNINGNWIKFCHPIVYKPYHVQKNKSDKLTFEPLQASWDVSPIFFKLLENKGISADGKTETNIKELLEKAEKSCTESQRIGKIFSSLLVEKYPELKKEFINNAPTNIYSDWLFFTAPKDYSAIVKNLILDYDRLIKAIEEKPDEIGGFNLFEQSSYKQKDYTEIVPVVSLNDNQMKVVKSVLSGNEISVVSGPPGCGKSQVVISILLNAWKDNKSVLFASSNNQAVNVIRDRMRRFENDIPLVVRTGSTKNSELLPSLEKMSSVIDSYQVSVADDSTDDKISKLKKNYDKFEEIINSNIAHEVNELYKAALSSFAKHTQLSSEKDEIIESCNNSLKKHKYNTDIFKFNEDVFFPFNTWMEEYSSMLKSIEADNKYRNKLIDERTDYTNTIKEYIYKYYTKESVPGNSSQLNDFNNWSSIFKTFVSDYSTIDFRDIAYNSDYSIWNETTDVDKWIDTSEKAIAEINFFLGTLKSTADEVTEKKKNYSTIANSLQAKGIKFISENQFNDINCWKEYYNEYILLPDNSFPFSKKKKINKKLFNLEKSLINIFDSNLIGKIEKNPSDLRNFIIKFYDEIEEEYEERTKIASLDDKTKEINDQLSVINKYLTELKINCVSDYNELENIKTLIYEKKALAKTAHEFFLVAERKKEFLDNAKTIMYAGSRLFSPYSFDLIENSEIADFYNCICSGLNNISAKSLFSNLNHYISSDVIEKFIFDLTNIYDIKLKIENLTKKIESVCSEEDYHIEWKNKCPSAINKSNMSYKQIVPLLPQWQEDIKNFHDDIEKKIKDINDLDCQKEIALNWANDNLDKAIEKAPEELLKENKEKIREHLKNNIFNPDYIADIFSKIEINKLVVTRNSIKNSLDNYTLKEIISNRLSLISKDNDVKATLQTAIMHYKKHGDTLTSQEDFDFCNLLKALPLWITTGNSPQSIPMTPKLFDILIIDEATQCAITSVLPLIYRCKQIVVIGDSNQLPSIDNISLSTEKFISSNYGIEDYLPQLGHCGCNIYKSVLKLRPQGNNSIITLTDHYRSHPLIIGFSNNYIYKNKLVLKKQMTNVDLNNVFGIFGEDVSGYALKDPTTDSWYNNEEAEKVVQLIQDIRENDNYSNFSVGVITPFRGQVEHVTNLLNKYSLNSNVSVSTVHKYQGDERDIIIFSPVVSKGMSEGAAKWVQSPPNLINVALTRAKEALFVVSDFRVCKSQHGILGNLINYIEKVELLRKTSLYELQLFGLMTLQNWSIDVHPTITDIEVDFIVRDDNKTPVVVEVDGSQHKNQTVIDAGRDAHIKSKGYDIIRFTTNEVADTPLDTINKIQKKLNDSINL